LPFTEGLNLIDFLVSQDIIGKWLLEGLPNDELSKQNGIIISASSRYPMMIDPQGQALTWIIRRESGVLPASQWITNLNDKYMKDKIGNCIEGGDACLIQNIENEMDPMLDPVLEKQYVQTGRQKKIKLGDADLDWDDHFRL
jgi:dynein heavy chain